MLGASPYPLSVARLAFNLTKFREVCYDSSIARGDKEKESKMLKFQNSHQCPQCGESVRGGFNVPSVSLDWVCQDCHREWEV